jgi:serine protease inhibitor
MPLKPLLLLLLFISLLSCHKSVTSPDISKTLDLPAGSQSVITAGNQFAMNFFGTVLRQDTSTSNKLISPFSIYMALSMLCNGSAGPTRDSMTNALALSGIPLTQLNATCAALLKQMPSEDSKVSLSIANSIWYTQAGPQPLPGFLDTVGSDYNGYLKALDFNNTASVKTINSWVAGKTDNKITSILDDLPPGSLMVLVNAIYFNGAWQNGFTASETRNAAFNLPGGNTVSVPFMNQEVTLRIDQDTTYTLLELPYGSGKNFDMYIVLPNNPRQSITAFEAGFTSQTLAGAMSRLDSLYVGLSLPKWEYAYSIAEMKPNLSMLGMGIIYGDADFLEMYTAPVNVTKSVHKAYIQVSESGTVAAAATAITIGLTDLPAIPEIQVNHPFLYFITEKQTGAILFMGTVNNPTS